MKRYREPSVKLPGPDIVPLIDVVFLLLVFFFHAVLHMAVQHDMDITLPSAAASGESPSKTPVIVTVTSEGRVSIEDRSVPVDRLAAEIAAMPGDSPQRPIRILADRDSRTGLTVNVMSRLKTAGYSRVVMAVEVP